MAKSNSFIDALARMIGLEKEEEPEREERRTAPRPRPASRGGASVYERNYRSSRGETAQRRPSARPTSAGGSMTRASSVPAVKPDTVVYYLSTLSECADVIRDILDGTSAVINFDETDDRMSQRIIDTLSGAAFALNAKVRKITDSTYLIAPANVNINTTGRVNRKY